ncbi:hypothetical protein BN1723_017985, partial [Verticillium longisporum]
MPKQDENVPQDGDDDDAVIDVIVEGNAVSAAAARNEILKIVGDRGASATTKLRDIPAQFYPFIAGPNNSLLIPFETDGVQIRVPPYQAWASEPLPAVPNPGQRPTFVPASRDNHISLAGDRASVQAARSAIDRRVQELHDQLLMQQVSIQPGRHQFIIGPRGVTADQFLSETGCAIFLPDDGDNDTITVIGPPQHIDNGMEHAMDLAMNMQSSSLDISRFHKNAPGGGAQHARNVTRFLRHRGLLAQLEEAHNFHANTPRASDGGALPWELYARDGKNALKAQSSISSLVNAFPPSRLSAIPVDPFFHAYLRKDVTPRMTQSHGVHVILPGAEDSDGPVLLVFEGPSATESKPEIKPGAPSADEIKAFQQGIEEASKHILDIINKQENITAASIDVPHNSKFVVIAFAIFVLLLSILLREPAAATMPNYKEGIMPLYQVHKPPFTIEAPGYEKVEGETLPRRSPKAKDGLRKRPAEDVNTIYDIVKRSARVYPNEPAAGTRKLIKLHKETKKISKNVDGEVQEVEKEWQFFELSPFSFLTYAELHKYILQLGSGLRKLGLSKGMSDVKIRCCVIRRASLNWMALSHACGSQSISLVTAYDTLGEEGLEHSLLQTDADAMYIDPQLLKTATRPLKKAKTVKFLIYNDA